MLNQAGQLIGCQITSGGSGYEAPPLVTITSATGTGAAGIATLANGAVTGVTILKIEGEVVRLFQFNSTAHLEGPEMLTWR